MSDHWWNNAGFWSGLPLWLVYHAEHIAWLSFLAGVTLFASGVRRDFYIDGGTTLGWFMKIVGLMMFAWPITWVVVWIVFWMIE